MFDMKLVSKTYSRDLNRKEETFVMFAKDLANLSKCQHGQVAAVFTNFDQIYSIGINGGPKHQMDCCCNGKDAKYGCAHAEQNCLVKNNNTTDSKIMICTKACCPTCATLLVNACANIHEFWYMEDYKDETGLKILETAGIRVLKIE